MSKKSTNDESKSRGEVSVAKIGLISAVLTALIGSCGVCIAAYFGFLNSRIQISLPIEATQTAEAKLSIDFDAIETKTPLSTTIPPNPTDIPQNVTTVQSSEEVSPSPTINMTDGDTQIEKVETEEFLLGEQVPIRWEGVFRRYDDETFHPMAVYVDESIQDHFFGELLWKNSDTIVSIEGQFINEPGNLFEQTRWEHADKISVNGQMIFFKVVSIVTGTGSYGDGRYYGRLDSNGNIKGVTFRGENVSPNGEFSISVEK